MLLVGILSMVLVLFFGLQKTCMYGPTQKLYIYDKWDKAYLDEHPELEKKIAQFDKREIGGSVVEVMSAIPPITSKLELMNKQFSFIPRDKYDEYKHQDDSLIRVSHDSKIISGFIMNDNREPIFRVVRDKTNKISAKPLSIEHGGA